MPAQLPALVTSNTPVADQIGTFVVESSGRQVCRYNFAECRQYLGWNSPGVVVLVASGGEDWQLIANVAREASLRKSRLKIAVVCAAEGNGTARAIANSPFCAMQFSWPTQADEIVSFIREAPDSTKGRPGDDLADRLFELTPSLAPMADRLARAAAHDLTVLLTGETGTGKTFMARLLHDFSPRQNQPFLMVPCGAQAANLFESCFFGHVRGAFTSAHQAQKGKFAAAGKGTILLDEIDTLGLEQQAALLRVIETGEYEQVGGHVTFRSEARIIAASNRDLDQAVEEGRLRADLYYRINVLTFHLPPLRERPQDIGPLARAFAAHYSTRFDKSFSDITAEAMSALEVYPWPGNVRQLDNVMQQTVLAADGHELTVFDLPAVIRHSSRPVAPRADSPVEPNRTGVPVNGRKDALRFGNSLGQSKADYERHLIRKALEDSRFNRSTAARALGVSRVTLHKKIKQYGLSELW